MKNKFLIVIILGIVNAVVIGIIVKKHGIDNTTSVIKGIFNSKFSKFSKGNGVNVQKENDFKSSETIINNNQIVKEDNPSNKNNQPLNENTIENKVSKEEKIENTNNQKESNNKSSIMADLDISHVVVGPLDVNCYVIGDPKSKKALVIDPGGHPQEILKILKEKNFELESIYLTHAHFDHMLGIAGLLKSTKPKIYLHEADKELYQMLPLQVRFFGFGGSFSADDTKLPEPDVLIKEGDKVMINSEAVATIYHTPGHSPGSVCYHFEKLNKIYTGDTLFRNSVGRSDLWQGSYEDLRNSVRGKLFKLDDNIEVYPGHGPSSNMGYEKTHNLSV